MEYIRVFHVEDYQIMRDGVQYLLSKDPRIKIVGEARTGEQAISRLQYLDVDVLILDIYLDSPENPNQMNGIDVCKVIREKYPSIRILAHTVYNDADKVARIIRAGALGFVSKKAGFEELTHAVKEVYASRTYINHDTALRLNNLNNFLEGLDPDLRSKDELFSVREREVLNLLAHGRSSREIALELGITERTVETHRKNMIEKGRMKNTAELVAYATSLGLTMR